MAKKISITTPPESSPFTVNASFSFPYPNYTACAPPPAAWDKLISDLRLTAKLDLELNRSQADHPIRAMMQLTKALVDYFRHSPTFHSEPELADPLVRLSVAFAEVYAGRAPPLLKPLRTGGNPGTSLPKQDFMATAALAVHYLMESGLRRVDAAKTVVRAIETADPGLPITPNLTARTILGWRNLLNEGPSRVPLGALKGFEMELSAFAGTDPKERALWLLDQIKHSPLMRY